MSRRSLRRRSSARLKGGLGLTALAGVTVLTLAACGSSGSSSSASSGSTPTSSSTSSVGSTTSGSIVWEASPLSGTGANDARTVLINAFEKAYPNIKVTLVSAPTDTDTYRATVATHRPPVLFRSVRAVCPLFGGPRVVPFKLKSANRVEIDADDPKIETPPAAELIMKTP